jgi:hypothetical protein
MASVTTPIAPPRTLGEAQQQVRSPLERLRGYIRTYVGLEGAAVVGLYLALWFWIGLVVDYGFFKLFGIDWVQELPWSFRACLLGLLLAGLVAAVAVKVLTRLFREFRDPALALLLERRFGAQLGDRLITAVELSDPDKAERLGYSPAMVRATIHEAAARVADLPVQHVFDWRRLRRRGTLIAVLTVGLYLLAGAGFTAVASARQGGFTMAGFRDLGDVATIWFERSILLRNVIWPRRAMLELLDLPAGGEIRVGRGATPPTIRARALKYVIAGRPSPAARAAYRSWLESRGEHDEALEAHAQAFARPPAEGWRALSWFDLDSELLGTAVPAVTLPDWAPRNIDAGLTLDEIELRLDKPETHQALPAEAHEAFRNVLSQIQLRAADPALRRTLRVLAVPAEAALLYKGRTTNGRSTLQRLADNEYSGRFGDLTESVTFTVQGEDYTTPTGRVTVVEPPALETLTREEERPAYLYYRPFPGSDPRLLHLKKQPFVQTEVSLQGGEVSRVDLPAGTNITLTARASKDLRSVRIVPRKAGQPVQASQPQMLDARTFRTRLEDVRQEQAFTFEFVDTDGVTGQRQVTIVPAEDAPPKIRELAPDDIVRRVKEGYMVAVGARVPFKGKVHDDYGLSALRYVYTVRPLQSRLPVEDRLLLDQVASAVAAFALEGSNVLGGAGRLAQATELVARRQQEREGSLVVKSLPLPRFEQALRERPEEFLPMTVVEGRLARPQQLPYRTLLNEFEIRPDEWNRLEEDPLGCDFPVFKLDLRLTSSLLTQPRYQVDVRLEAADTDLDGALENGRPVPQVKASDERFSFIVVSENELLTEIAKEEEKLYTDLEQADNKLLETETKLVQVVLDLSGERVKADDLGPMSIRCEQVVEVLEKAQLVVRDVASSYTRIHRELRTNQVNPKYVEKVETTIVKPLGDADGFFEKARDAVLAFRAGLDSKEGALEPRVAAARIGGGVAKEQMRALIAHLNGILVAMQGVTDINKLVKILRDIEQREQEQYETIDAIYKKQVDDAFKGLLEDKPKGKK